MALLLFQLQVLHPTSETQRSLVARTHVYKAPQFHQRHCELMDATYAMLNFPCGCSNLPAPNLNKTSCSLSQENPKWPESTSVSPGRDQDRAHCALPKGVSKESRSHGVPKVLVRLTAPEVCGIFPYIV